MSTPRDPLSYSDHWFTLVHKVMDEGVCVDLPATTPREKKTLQLEWQGFKKALRTSPEFESVYRKAAQIRTTTKAGDCLRFASVNNTDIAKALSASLGDITAPAAPTGTDQLQQSDFVADDSDTIVLMSKYMKG